MNTPATPIYSLFTVSLCYMTKEVSTDYEEDYYSICKSDIPESIYALVRDLAFYGTVVAKEAETLQIKHFFETSLPDIAKRLYITEIVSRSPTSTPI